jgi:hypothetical protein
MGVDTWTEYVKAHPTKPTSLLLLDELRQALHQRDMKIAALVARVEALEARKTMHHCGVWREDATYSGQDIVSFRGEWWLAKRQTTARPGGADEASRAWVQVTRR